MSQSIAPAPGSKVCIKVIKAPTSAAAEKTLVRLLRKDALVQKEAARLRQARKLHAREQGRGGRIWTVRRPAIAPVKATVGTTGTLTASLDVLTDLRTVAKFVEVSPV